MAPADEARVGSQTHSPARPTLDPARRGISALQSSAWRRLAFVAVPVLILWVAVAFALDLL